ncbi:hypothetical protein NGRA_0648, partial [Nosema granulosis]
NQNNTVIQPLSDEHIVTEKATGKNQNNDGYFGLNKNNYYEPPKEIVSQKEQKISENVNLNEDKKGSLKNVSSFKGFKNPTRERSPSLVSLTGENLNLDTLFNQDFVNENRSKEDSNQYSGIEQNTRIPTFSDEFTPILSPTEERKKIFIDKEILKNLDLLKKQDIKSKNLVQHDKNPLNNHLEVASLIDLREEILENNKKGDSLISLPGYIKFPDSTRKEKIERRSMEKIVEKNIPENVVEDKNILGEKDNVVVNNNIPENSTVENNIPENSTLENNNLENSTLENNIPENSTVENNIPENSTLENNIPENSTVENNIPENSTVENNIPENSTLENNTLENNNPENNTLENNNVENNNVENSTVENNNVENSTVENNNVENNNIENSTVENNIPENNNVENNNVEEGSKSQVIRELENNNSDKQIYNKKQKNVHFAKEDEFFNSENYPIVDFNEDSNLSHCSFCEEKRKTEKIFVCEFCRCIRKYEKEVTKGNYLNDDCKRFSFSFKEKTDRGIKKERTTIVSGKNPGSSEGFTTSSEFIDDDELFYGVASTKESAKEYSSFSESSSSIRSAEDLNALSSAEDLNALSSVENLSINPSSSLEASSDEEIKSIIPSSVEEISALYKTTYRGSSSNSENSPSEEDPKNLSSWEPVDEPIYTSIDPDKKNKQRISLEKVL